MPTPRLSTAHREGLADAARRGLVTAAGGWAVLAVTGCSTAPQGRGSFGGGPPAAPRLSPDEASDVTIHAVGLVGTPYRYGGNTPDSGFDCSGLIGYVYRTSARINAPRTVASLVNWGQPISSGDVRSGDLVVFTFGGAATHAGIFVGDGRFVHAPSTGGEVRLDQFKTGYWSRQVFSFRRP
ncbi:MAG: peptidoglycan endopeptidase [Comamonadaceae bacterium]|nr:MAG: peptidoglycan endopeptidase [Comamonadaceae bacterium]